MLTPKVTDITLEQFKSDQICFKLVLKHLYVASVKYFRSWGLNTIDGVNGIAPKDVVSKIIEGVFNPDFKFDPSRGSLYNYLNNCLLRGDIANLAKSKSVRSRVEYDEGTDYDLNKSITFEDENRAQFMLNEIAKCLGNNLLAFAIVMAQYDGLKRREIMEQERINEAEYAAAYRRVSKCQEIMSVNITK